MSTAKRTQQHYRAHCPKLITVLLAEDHTLIREGLMKLLEAESDIEVVDGAVTGREAVDMTGILHPDVVVMDIGMPLLNGFEATRQILQSAPESRVLMLSAHCDDAYVEKAMMVGAAGYMNKQSSAQGLAEAIREIRKGNTIFSPDIARRYHKRHQDSLDRTGHAKTRVPLLSSREIEVLQLIAEGQANKQIAAELGISIKTVEKHRGHLMQKLDIHDTATLTRYAITEGIIESSIQLMIA